MGRGIVAVIAGVVSAFVIILVVEGLGHLIVPVPGSPPLSDKVAMGHYLASLPVPAYAFVLLAYFAGCYAGGRVAARVATGRLATPCAWIVGALVFAATIANLMMITHPTWFVVATIVIIVVATWAATRGPLRAPPPVTGT